jgi:hypothetical protein
VLFSGILGSLKAYWPTHITKGYLIQILNFNIYSSFYLKLNIFEGQNKKNIHHELTLYLTIDQHCSNVKYWNKGVRACDQTSFKPADHAQQIYPIQR